LISTIAINTYILADACPMSNQFITNQNNNITTQAFI